MSTTIAAISTAIGPSGIGIVRMSGDKARHILNKVYKGKSTLNNRELAYGHIYNGEKKVDEVLVSYMEAPRTYTREDVVEIYCHGGVVAVKEILDTLLLHGAVLAEPGEFTKRAFLNGRLDLAQAEAVIDLINSNTSLSYENSLNQLGGSISKSVNGLYDKMLEVMATIVADIDFPEDEIETLSSMEIKEKLIEIEEEIASLLKNSKRGKVLREGIRTLILGRPNVGKSSLLNALLKENRAIVTDIPGTTRDTIEEILDLDGIPLKLIDTAGIRQTEDIVEKIGVDKAKGLIEDADLLLIVLDNSSKITEDDIEIIEASKDKEHIIIANKIDLDEKLEERALSGKDIVRMSLIEGEGIDALLDKIKDKFFSEKINVSEGAYMSNMRQIESLRNAQNSVNSAILDIDMNIPFDLIEVDLNNVITELGNITGKTTSEDVLDRIFSEFCIGK